MKKTKFLLCMVLFSMLFTACSKNNEVVINGEKKTVSHKFIKTITKKNELTVKSAIIDDTGLVYKIEYQGKTYKVYNFDGNNAIVKLGKEFQYEISSTEYERIQKEAK